MPKSVNVIADAALFEIKHNKPELLGGILNSCLCRFFKELHGRTLGGGLGEIMVYEAKEWPILNPLKLSDKEEKRIVAAFKDLQENKKIESSKLDKAVLASLGLEDHAKEISDYAKALSKARRKGKEVSEMIAGVEEEVKIRELEGAEIVGEGAAQRKLNNF